MNAKIFVFGVGPEQDTHLFDFMISETFSCVMDEEDEILYYDSVRDATADISRAFSSADTVLFFADEAKFAEVKHILCKALGQKLKVDQNLLSKLTQSGSMEKTDTAAAVCHAGIPDRSVPFTLSDCRFTGFGMRRSKQTVIVLPTDVARLSILLPKQVIPYLNDFYESDIPTEFAAYVYAYSLEDKLRDSDLQIAVSDTKTTALFRRYISNAGRLQDSLPVAAKAEQRGNTPPDEYVVNLSIAAAEFFRAPLGIAISNAYYTGDDADGEKKVYMAVTTESESTVREVSSYNGESTSDFLFRCCGEMCALVEQILDASDCAYKAVYEEDDEIQGKRVFHAVFSVFIALTAVLVAFGIYYFTANDYTLKDWARAHLPLYSYFVPADAPVTEEITTVKETTTKKKEVSTTKKADETTTAEETTTAAAYDDDDDYDYDYDDDDDDYDYDSDADDYDYDSDDDADDGDYDSDSDSDVEDEEDV